MTPPGSPAGSGREEAEDVVMTSPGKGASLSLDMAVNQLSLTEHGVPSAALPADQRVREPSPSATEQARAVTPTTSPATRRTGTALSPAAQRARAAKRTQKRKRRREEARKREAATASAGGPNPQPAKPPSGTPSGHPPAAPEREATHPGNQGGAAPSKKTRRKAKGRGSEGNPPAGGTHANTTPPADEVMAPSSSSHRVQPPVGAESSPAAGTPGGGKRKRRPTSTPRGPEAAPPSSKKGRDATASEGSAAAAIEAPSSQEDGPPDGLQSYADAVTKGNLQFSIVAADEGTRLVQADLYHWGIWFDQQESSVPSTSAAPPPVLMEFSRLRSGEIQVRAVNQQSLERSRDWAKAMPGRPDGPSGYRVVEGAALRFKLWAWIPLPNLTRKGLVEKLREKNPELRPEGITVVYEGAKDEGKTFVVLVSREYHEALRKKSFCPFFGNGKVWLRPTEEKERGQK